MPETAKAMLRLLTTLLICGAAWLPAYGLADESDSTDDTSGWQLSPHHWHQRVEDARRRTEAFVAAARSRQTETSPPITHDEASAADQRIMNDDNLRPGDVVATSKGLFVFVGRSEGQHAPDDFKLVQDAAQLTGTAKR